MNFPYPQVYGGTSQVEEKETVIWARFLDFESVLFPEFCDELTEELHRSVDSTLLLLGYKNGIQAWTFEVYNEDLYFMGL